MNDRHHLEREPVGLGAGHRGQPVAGLAALHLVERIDLGPGMCPRGQGNTDP